MTERRKQEQSSARAKPRQAAGTGSVGPDLGEDDNQIVLALARGLEVLDAFRRGDTGLGNAELANRTGLPKPTVSRVAYTLARHGYLRFDPKRRDYSLGVKAVSLGAIAFATTDVRRLAFPLMRELADSSHFNVGLGVRSGHHMVYTDACEGSGLVSLRLFAGSRVPIATSAMGRAHLASLSPAQRDEAMAELRPHYDDDWPRVQLGVQRAVRDLAEFGACLSLGDWHKDIHGIAAPVKTHPGQPAYAVNLGGPAYALSENELRHVLAPKIAQLAASVETLIGTSDPDGAHPENVEDP